MKSIDAFHEFERAGWGTESVCEVYDHHFGAVTSQSVQAHDNADFDMPQKPDSFGFSDPMESRRRMEAAGFAAIAFTIVPQTWRVRTLDEAIAAVMEGTVRARAALQSQPPEAMVGIRAALGQTWALHRREFGYELPMPVVLASGAKQ